MPLKVLDGDKLSDIFNMEKESLPENNDSFDDSIIDVAATPVNQPQQKQFVTEEDVYLKLGQMIENGNQVFENIRMILEDNPDAELLASASSMLSTIKDIMREFTRLRNDKLNFERKKELEVLKAQLKNQQIMLKSQEAQKMLSQRMQIAQGPGILNENDVQLVPFCQEEVVKALVAARESTQSSLSGNA